MRVLVLYDLPSTDGDDRRAYSLFHRYLVQNGFLMLQESVYCKLALNMTAVQAILANLRRNKPAAVVSGAVHHWEKQFARVEFSGRDDI